MTGSALSLCLAIIYYYLCIILCYLCIICIIVYLSRVRRNSPRGPAWCWRRIPVDRSARGVYDSDAYCSGSAHGVPMLVRCRRCMSMAVRELNSMDALESHGLRGICLCGSPVSSTRCRHADTRGGVHYAVQVEAPSQLLGIYGGLPRFTPSNYKI
jgi:hypothetical protein